MKIFIIITLKLFLLNSVLFAQCYQENIDEGIKHFNSGNYTKAKEFFEDALKCRFNYIGDNEAAGEWISKCNEKIYGVYVGSVTIANVTEILGTATSSVRGQFTERGVVYSAHANPTLKDNIERPDTESETFSVNLISLRDNTYYYIRTYAINKADTIYGFETRFRTLGYIDYESAEIFLVVEDPPKYPGGEDAKMSFLKENIRYPEEAERMGIQGTVYVTFIVEPNGSLSNIKVIRGIGGGCDEEAVRVVGNMPKWKPGKQREQAVRTQFNMPVKFVIK